ncbi:DUF411 domain-containing protein [Aureimonas jatrophae]|uniref:DUF411 domain-containing protein n=1 Tax=Aureimonas jatrophae TaxID=1166073 RepID=UPI0017C1929C|nr:DUF411 domain-containing protein [Aureimonas jatrophae]MBB3951491.1 hypothetical protein [Aureimonas jatrophae]
MADIARKHGFDVTVEDREDMTAVKRSLGVTEAVESCHTARIGGYVVEGHVPMEAVDRLLAERPQVAGIAAPGMPAGSPGMGDDLDAEFDVLSFGGASAAPATTDGPAGPNGMRPSRTRLGTAGANDPYTASVDGTNVEPRGFSPSTHGKFDARKVPAQSRRLAVAGRGRRVRRPRHGDGHARADGHAGPPRCRRPPCRGPC